MMNLKTRLLWLSKKSTFCKSCERCGHLVNGCQSCVELVLAVKTVHNSFQLSELLTACGELRTACNICQNLETAVCYPGLVKAVKAVHSF